MPDGTHDAATVAKTGMTLNVTLDFEEWDKALAIRATFNRSGDKQTMHGQKRVSHKEMVATPSPEALVIGRVQELVAEVMAAGRG